MALARSLIPRILSKQKRRPVTPAEQRLCDVEHTRTERGAPHCRLPMSGATWSPDIARGVLRGGCPPARACQGSTAACRLLHLDPQRQLRFPSPLPCARLPEPNGALPAQRRWKGRGGSARLAAWTP